MKIYINGRFLTQPISGVQRYGIEILKSLDSLLCKKAINGKLWEFEVLTPNKNLITNLELKAIPIKKCGVLTGHLWEQFELPFICGKNVLFCLGNLAPVLSLFTNKHVFVTVHDLSFRYFPKAYSLLFRIYYRLITPIIFWRSAGVITVSNSELKSLLKIYQIDSRKIVAIQNGPFSSDYMQELSNSEKKTESKDQVEVLYVGAINKRKNIEGFLSAIRLISNKIPVRGIIIGAGAGSFSKFNLKESMRGSDNIYWRGQINNINELIEFYRTAKCFVFPSFYEASPLPPIEAMAAGCPVIASSIEANMERCGTAALYCDPNNPADIAEKIEMVITQSELRDELIEMGFQKCQEYSWERTVIKTFHFIAEKIMN
ncbi:MAG: glycosyltransferase family 4 protein [Deltaproteobacteria bacterium]|nr:glycosyltransferase family 4 protein [Deltaproteobacteria bacterium]